MCFSKTVAEIIDLSKISIDNTCRVSMISTRLSYYNSKRPLCSRDMYCASVQGIAIATLFVVWLWHWDPRKIVIKLVLVSAYHSRLTLSSICWRSCCSTACNLICLSFGSFTLLIWKHFFVCVFHFCLCFSLLILRPSRVAFTSVFALPFCL